MTADYDIIHSGVVYPAGTLLPGEVAIAHGLIEQKQPEQSVSSVAKKVTGNAPA